MSLPVDLSAAARKVAGDVLNQSFPDSLTPNAREQAAQAIASVLSNRGLLRDPKDLTPDQAFDLARYLG